MFSLHNSSDLLKFFKDLIIPDLLPMYLSLRRVITQKSESLILERVTGVEPVSRAWQARIIATIRYPQIAFWREFQITKPYPNLTTIYHFFEKKSTKNSPQGVEGKFSFLMLLKIYVVHYI